MTEAQEVYQGLMKEVARLQRRLRDLRIQKTLAKLANSKGKSAYVRHLEADLGSQLDRNLRDNERIDNLLDILEDLI